MDEKLRSATDPLPGKARAFNIALYYVKMDEEKAGRMLAGDYKDLYVLRAKFSSASLYGAFIIFFNHIYNQILHISQIVSPLYLPEKIETRDKWKIFEKEIVDSRSEVDHDDVLGNTLRDKLYNVFTLSFSKEIGKMLQRNDDIAVDNLLRKILHDSVGLRRVQMEVESQNISSLDMELNSITSKKIDPKELMELKKAKSSSEEGDDGDEEKSDVPQPGKDGIKLILKCSLILSPIKGMHISKLGVGDRVSISIVDNSEDAIRVAEAFNAYKDGKFSPITARIKSVDYTMSKGYQIYAVIAKGILAQISEEEENIKIAMDPAFIWSRDDVAGKKKKSNFPMIVIFAILFVILIIVVLSFIL